MALLAGTLDGCYRIDTAALGAGGPAPERTLDAAVHRLRSTPDGAVAAAEDGLFRTADGREWERLLAADLRSVHVGGEWAAGTADGRLLRSADGSEWTEHRVTVEGAPDPGEHPRTDDDAPSVRTITGAGGSLWVGFEVGGVYRSRDGGDTWLPRVAGVHDDVHHLTPVVIDGKTGLVAACGNGCYVLPTSERTWWRLDTGFEDFWYNYHRESLVHDGRLHLGANAWGPEAPGGRLFEVPIDPGRGALPFDGRDARVVPFPDDDEAFPLSWAVHDGTVYAGTMRARDGFEQTAPAPLLRRSDDGPRYESVVEVPAAPRTLAVV